MKENCKNEVLELVDEVEILGHKIKMYGSIDFPWFMAKDVAEWIDYSKGSNGKYQITNMVKMTRPRQHRHLKRKDSIRFLVLLVFSGFFIFTG